MLIKIKRFDKQILLPTYKTSGAAAIDLYSRVTVTIKPHSVELIPLNIAIEVPNGYFSLLVTRSSTYKLGLTSINGVGIIDRDYCGDNDELMFPLMNYTSKKVTIEKATRIAQLIIIKNDIFDIKEVDKLKSINRGGFGTTGKK